MLDRIASFTNDGLTFDVRDEGPLDGTPVVLLHGFPQTSSSWRAVATLLHDAGCRTLTPDQRGYSPGARPSGRTPYALDRLIGDIAALVDRVGTPVHLVGHDWGAMVAWGLAATHPERVRSLTAVSVTHPGAFLRSLGRLDQLRRSWYIVFFRLPRLPEWAMARPAVHRRALRHAGMSREAVTRYRSEMLDGGALRGGLGWYRAIPLGSPALLRRRVAVPTTMVWSDGDVALGRHGVELAQEYVDAGYSFVELAGVSHWIPEEAPEALAAAILDRMASN
ncbi:alpha/beta fold hydrolase [Nocardioides rotundus]|uniref:alpha/beta fold hydrolase n=1 Tax=Nocardioides rotundus TaxID=1774216 RepID=UPI001CBE376D|nr:alpha/beta fold hydrolase [Nocardioides rotundus]UAL31277.1 alpha/beta fold hydrolase [Nocardioides rotundus]